MKQIACPRCEMSGKVFGDQMCTNCAGTGRVWDHSADAKVASKSPKKTMAGVVGGGAGGAKREAPAGWPLMIFGGSAWAAWSAYTIHPDDLPMLWAFLSFFAVLISLGALLYVFLRPIQSLILIGIVVVIDWLLLGWSIWNFIETRGAGILLFVLLMFLPPE